ncbi:MAG: XisI protein [Anaerolineales bacterium]|nr:XisI protein [Anaerolineales bacterium]
MDTRSEYQRLIKNILLEYSKFNPAYGNIDSKVLFDDERGSYALLQVGWEGTEYVHGDVIHIDLIGDQIWIQYDGTEEGVASELVEAGVPREKIVLGFRPPKLRQHTGFAVG